MLVDDSIVRGTTCRQIISMARQAGANKVYFASAAPPVLHPNVYGIDMPSYSELVAANKTIEEVRKIIGADGLIYQKLPQLVKSVKEGNKRIRNFECSIFDGNYITRGIDSEYLAGLDLLRRGEAKTQMEFFDELASTYHE